MCLNSASLIARTQAFIARHQLLPPGSRILLGLSGGVDSVTLADVLGRLVPLEGWELHALYVNHGLRPEADAEAEALARFCAERAIPYRAERVTLTSDGLSPEEAARHARYAAFNAVATQMGATRLALAHHADDQLETVLFRWVQGSGSGGLAGMRPYREQPEGPPVVRPFLEVPRAEIEAYHAERGLPAWEDATNRDATIPRNLLRHRVLPALKELNPRLLEALPLHLALMADEHDWLERAARDAAAPWRRCVREGLIAWDRAGFLALPRALRRRVLHAAFREVGGRLRRLTARGVERVLDRWEAGEAGGIDLADGVRAFLQGEWIALDRDPAPLEPISLAPRRMHQGSGELAIAVPEGQLTLRAEPAGGQVFGPERVAFGAEAWPEDAVLRRADPEGDRFVPWGHRQPHALNRFLARAKVFEPLRRRLWVIASGSDVLWVVGMRRSANFALTEGEKTVFTASWAGKQGLTTPPTIPTMRADR
ncbi:tRNA(Ile)-lysidine synthase [compost metagenome]